MIHGQKEINDYGKNRFVLEDLFYILISSTLINKE